MFKKVIFYIFLILVSSNIFSLPFRSSGLWLGADVSADFLTISELSNSSIWYRTVMPAYSVDGNYDYLTNENELHRSDFGVKYFESNCFKMNTVELEPGDMRILLLNIYGDYTRYLPFVSYLDYITGLKVSGTYDSYGWVVSSEGVRVNSFFDIKVGPVNGFSVNIPDLFEVRSVFGILAGIPVSGSIEYPGDLEKAMYPLDLLLEVQTEATLFLNRISLSIFYNWSQEFIAAVEDEAEYFTPISFNSRIIHSAGISACVKL